LGTSEKEKRATMEDFQLTAGQIVSLKVLHRTLRDRKKADRVKAVVLLGTGWTPQQVAEALLIDEKTVHTWFEKYHCGGEEELLVLRYQGKSPRLNETQQSELTRHLDENTYLTSKEIRHYIEKTYKVKYSSTGIKELLHRLNFVYKKPKHVPGKLNPVKQAEFVVEYEKLKKTKGKNDPIYFADGCHPQFNSIPAYGWIRRGVEKELKSNGGRKRVNINGAVDLESLQTCVDFTKTINGESSLRLFRKIEKRHPDAKEIHIVLDNATYYKSKWLRKQLEGMKIKLHFLPGYSPNLNVIERLWKFFKKKLLYNTYYEKFDDFLATCKNFFRCRTKYEEELRSLLTDNFHLYQNN
jgi:transposase